MLRFGRLCAIQSGHQSNGDRGGEGEVSSKRLKRGPKSQFLVGMTLTAA